MPLPEALSQLRSNNSHLALLTGEDGDVCGMVAPRISSRIWWNGARRHPPWLTTWLDRLPESGGSGCRHPFTGERV